MFYNSFDKFNKEINIKSLKNVNKNKYKYINIPKTLKSIELYKDIFKQMICKPQKLIENNKDYYVALDKYTNTIYICYKELLMLDIDLWKNDNKINLEKLNESLELFDVYKSKNGYHIFCISKKYDYNNVNTIQFMIDNNSDFYYNFYTYLRGFCVRLNRKQNEYQELISKRLCPFIYKYVGRYGKGILNKDLEKLVKYHFLLSIKYNNYDPIL